MQKLSSKWKPAAVAALLFAFFALPLAAGPGEDAGGSSPQPPNIKVKVSPLPDPLPSPGKGTLRVSLTIPSGYHLFGGDGLAVSPQEVEGVSFGKPGYPKGKMEEEFEVHRGTVSIDIPVTLSGTIGGKIEGKIVMDWQACQDFGDKVCFLPSQSDLSFEAAVGAAPPPVELESGQPSESASPEPIDEASPELAEGAPEETAGTVEPEATPYPTAESPAPETSKDDSYASKFQEVAKENIFLALLFAFGFGILASLTPCVYPVIPITVAYIGSRSEGKSKSTGFFLSLVFVQGMAIVYAILGAVSTKVGAAFGSLTATPWVGLPIAAIFFVLSFSMFGLFELKTPAFIANRLESGKQKTKTGGYLGAFIIGVISGLVASPCLGPLLLAILLVVAGTGSVLLGFFYLYAFALGMGVLFIVIGSFTGILSSLPKSGTWMDGIKILFGVLILGGAFYFAGLYLPRTTFFVVAGIGLALVVLFLLLGAKRHFLPVPLRIVAITLCFGALFAVQPLLPSTVVEKNWETELDAGLSKAKALGRPALLDFRADWCVACVELEERTWPDPEVEKALEEIVPIRLDHTKSTDQVKAERVRYAIPGLPTVILIAPSGEELGRFVGYKDPKAFLAWLEKAREN